MSKEFKKEFKTSLRESDYELPTFSPLQVKVHDNFNEAAKAFKAIVQKERLIPQYKRAQSYEKPSDKKRREKAENKRKAKEAEIKQQKILSGEYDREMKKKALLKEKKKAERIKKLNESNSEK